MHISQVSTRQDVEDAKSLFLEYAESLSFDLCFQSFDEELESLPGQYAPPKGGLWLGRDLGGALAGCVGLRPIVATDAEMKRLYVRPGFRGRALGRRLAETAVALAQDTGYTALRLDTISGSMQAAECMYRDMGFVETALYYDNPVPGATFYALQLSR